MIELEINKELKDLIRPLTNEEYSNLENSILQEGCRDALVIWNNIIVDGHNRYEICSKHNISFETVEKTFQDMQEAKIFILQNQLSRRNLNDYDRSVIALRLEPLFREKALQNKQEGIKKANEYNPNHSKTEEQQTNNKIKEDESICPTLDKSIERLKPIDTKKELSKIAGVSHGTIAKVKIIEEKATEEQKERLRKDKATINAVYREVKREDKKNDIQKIEPSKLEGKYNVILADPPWQYDNDSTAQTGNANDHYPTMTLDEIMNLPINDISLKPSVLFLWTTQVMIKKAFGVLEAWGFDFKTSMVWVKNQRGSGYYVRSKHEIILIATKGDFTPMTTDIPESVFFAEKAEHSKKPSIMYDIIEKMYPQQKYIELFARQKRENWHCWGNEV